jgi:uracil-DNA glycosylase family 4
MKKYPGAKPPPTKSLKKLDEASQACRGCDLYKNATQAVFGSGKSSAQIMIVGEQPGSSEDTVGEPFVGAAGGVLRDCLQKAGIDLDQVYMTNAVKHFKWVPSEGGKRRIHEKPSAAQVAACKPWLNKQRTGTRY